MGREFTINVSGIEATVRRLSTAVVDREMDRLTETYARKMATMAALNAPRKDGWLKGSLASSPQRVKKGVWSWGSDLPYALRQEYEHATQKGFVRRTIWEYRTEYREAVRLLLRGLGA